MSITVIESQCKGCMLCVSECVFGAISRKGDIVTIDSSLCTSCGVCVYVCPYNAIDIGIKRSIDSLAVDYRGIWVVAECLKKGISTSGLELIGKARTLADLIQEPLSVVLFAQERSAAVEEVKNYPVDMLFLIAVESEDTYDCRCYTTILSSLILTKKPSIVLIAATDQGRELAPSIAARIKTGLTADCTDLKIDSEGKLVQIRPAYGGNIMASIITPYHRPQMTTVRPGIFPKPDKRPSEPYIEVIRMDMKKIRSSVVLLFSEEHGSEYGDLENASFVVAGGAGMGSKENFKLLKELAALFGGAVGGSREAVDRGWIPKSQQIGQTGSSISSDVYIACGISGAIHHLVGIQRAKTIISVNSDPHSPIMRLSDVAIVGDVVEAIPQLIRICKKMRKP